ncbi:winged helix-turn-helix transcriptional regulator [Agrobacterium arsenijevicii]|uniref:HxlR family transcriptional regulator n=1 Tax=Agrobacterium arsenijevicii TaxID=1585697 RepID=A0ABR5D1V1_9HYPH|nr:HxlR family transcriptional regulator [Agrobacterium arsenijevicii]
MSREINGRPVIETSHGPVLTPCAPGSVLARLGDKWTILVISLLSLFPDAPIRFGALRRGIPDISQRMLTLTLRNLERDGLVARHYYTELLPRVEYELTDRGRSMLKPLAGFTDWIRDTWQDIEASRNKFDAGERSGN